MDLSHDQVFSETVKDFFLISLHEEKRNNIIHDGKERLLNKLNFYNDLDSIHKELEKIDPNFPEVSNH